MRGHPVVYSESELSWIEAHKKLTRKELTSQFNAKFNRSLSQVSLSALCKRKGWLTGRDGRFKKGNIPHPDARPKGANKTSFKKGNVPHNTVPVGTEVVATDGWIKVKIAEPDVWQSKARLVWEKQNGEIEPGMIIWHIDSNPLNNDISNLALISRTDNARLNKTGYHQEPNEIKPSLVLLSKIQTKTARLERKHDEAN